MSPEVGKTYMAMKLEKSPAVVHLLRERHIYEHEVKLVIYYGETTGQKLYQEGNDRLLAKRRFRGAVYYVEYSPTEIGFMIHTAYAHRSLLGEKED
jgi:glutamate synthase (NADPH) small chain